MSKITVTVSGETGSGKSAIAGEIEIALKAIGVPVFVQERDTMVVADYQHWIDLYKPEVTICEQNIPRQAPISDQLATQKRPTEHCPTCGLRLDMRWHMDAHQSVPPSSSRER